jgi:hypothetical protein
MRVVQAMRFGGPVLVPHRAIEARDVIGKTLLEI